MCLALVLRKAPIGLCLTWVRSQFCQQPLPLASAVGACCFRVMMPGFRQAKSELPSTMKLVGQTARRLLAHPTTAVSSSIAAAGSGTAAAAALPLAAVAPNRDRQKS